MNSNDLQTVDSADTRKGAIGAPIETQSPAGAIAATPATATARTAGGAPEGNTNRATHGLRSDVAFRAKLGNLPPAWRQAGRHASELRNALEDGVLATHGSISITQALLISTAARWERHAGLALRWLRENPGMELKDRLEFSREVAKASEARDKAVKQLGLPNGSDKLNPWELLKEIPDYERQQETTDAEPGERNDSGSGEAQDPVPGESNPQ